jgi:hypothetical protein
MKLPHPITWRANPTPGSVETFPKFRLWIHCKSPIDYVEVDLDLEVATWLELNHRGWIQTATLTNTILQYRYKIPNDLYILMSLKFS